MEEDEEIHFNRPEITPDTPRVSRNNIPDPEDEDRGETDYTVVLEMVKAEQVFALEEDDDWEEEMFAMVDRQQWNTQRAAEPPLSPELQQMFALARHMGYEMRPIARRFDAPRRMPGPQSSPNRDSRAPFRPRDYSRTKCFSCGQLGHTQVRCPKPDSSLPFRPSGWVDWSDRPQRRNGRHPQGNEI